MRNERRRTVNEEVVLGEDLVNTPDGRRRELGVPVVPTDKRSFSGACS